MTDAPRWRQRLIRAGVTTVVASVALRPQALAADQPLAIVLNGWTAAVLHHTPGTSDSAVAAVWAMTPEDRLLVRDHLHALLAFLDGADFSHAKGEQLVVAAAASSLFPVDRSQFLERAATLHADAVIFDARPPGTLATHQPLGQDRGGRLEVGEQAVFFASTDGEYLNLTLENPNWPLARSLLDELPPNSQSQAFATTWYHATTAYLLAGGNFGQAERNLAHAAQVMPESAETLFDFGCVTEALGMSFMQQVIIDDRGRPGVISAPRTIPSAKERSAQAEDLFGRAVVIDPHLPEARVRWARLLELEHRWTDATGQIALALSDHPDREVSFWGHLFGARAANALNQGTEAEAHLTKALDLFPQAESAILEASNTALRHSDPLRAKGRLMILGESGRDHSPASDPWLQYPLGPGRFGDAPLHNLWRAVPTRPH